MLGHRGIERGFAAAAACVALGLVWIVPVARASADPAGLVDPFNGTAPGAADFGTGGGAGNTFPGAALPFGMVELSPDTLPGNSAFGGGYSYGDSRIGGFSLKHMSGPGCAAYQDFPIMPATASVTESPAEPKSIGLADRFTADFAHADERASPGYYETRIFPRSGGAIRVRLTATTRTGTLRFTFPRRGPRSVLLNVAGAAMGTSAADVRIRPGAREVSGTGTSGQFCYQGNRYTLHFVARFNRGFAAYGTWRRDQLQAGSTSASDSIPGSPVVQQPSPVNPNVERGSGTTAQSGAYLAFRPSRKRVVEARVGISFVSVRNARQNLREAAGGSFGELRRAARERWDRALGRIRVGGGSRRNRGLFYTQLYHALLHPSTFSDRNRQYIGFDGRVHRIKRGARYADFSGWDTYRSQMPLVAMLFPGRAADMVKSLVAAGTDSGSLSKWSQANGQTHVMVGDPADPLIAGAWAFGARHFDRRRALDLMVKGADDYGPAATSPLYFQRQGLPEYLSLGYVPHELNTDAILQTIQPERAWGTVSTSLEYAVADFAIARLAGSACRRSTYQRFMARSANWRRLFDPSSLLVQPRSEAGGFLGGGPTATEDFVEGNAAQYTLAVPQDPAGLFAALGGRAAARARLDDFFSELNAGPDSPHAFLGNEPTLGMPWLYDWAGEPYKTQSLVRRAILGLYDRSPSGMPGNDDLGAMSSWWVLGALGIYPAVPGTDVLALGSPLFPRARIRLGRRQLRLIAPRAAPKRPYVRALRLNGATWARPWLRFRELRRGGDLRFALSARPHRGLGRAARDAPPSFSPDGRLRCG
jgi:predicted alpha-1,2-mannosidase